MLEPFDRDIVLKVQTPSPGRNRGRASTCRCCVNGCRQLVYERPSTTRVLRTKYLPIVRRYPRAAFSKEHDGDSVIVLRYGGVRNLLPTVPSIKRVVDSCVQTGRTFTRGDQHLARPIRVDVHSDGVGLTESLCNVLPGLASVLADVNPPASDSYQTAGLRRIGANRVNVHVDAIVYLFPVIAVIMREKDSSDLYPRKHAPGDVRKEIDGTNMRLMGRGREVPARARGQLVDVVQTLPRLTSVVAPIDHRRFYAYVELAIRTDCARPCVALPNATLTGIGYFVKAIAWRRCQDLAAPVRHVVNYLTRQSNSPACAVLWLPNAIAGAEYDIHSRPLLRLPRICLRRFC